MVAAVGKAGSSLTAELNRLAGITDVAQYLDAQGAANKWAGTTGLATVGALNYKVSGSRTRDNFKDIEEKKGKEVYETIGYFTSHNISFTLNKQIEEKNKCEEFLEECVNFSFVLKVLPQYTSTKKCPLPFITSTLQQIASNELHISPKETMKICQELYENGFITYMRTDNKKYCSQFIESTKQYILQQHSEIYINKKIHEIEIKNEKSSNKLTQEAHEAIRPTKIERTSLDEKFSAKTKKMYHLIWKNIVRDWIISCPPPHYKT
jgi:DNA topoisomerase-1